MIFLSGQRKQRRKQRGGAQAEASVSLFSNKQYWYFRIYILEIRLVVSLLQ